MPMVTTPQRNMMVGRKMEGRIRDRIMLGNVSFGNGRRGDKASLIRNFKDDITDEENNQRD
jgi:hypothetical protein